VGRSPHWKATLAWGELGHAGKSKGKSTRCSNSEKGKKAAALQTDIQGLTHPKIRDHSEGRIRRRKRLQRDRAVRSYRLRQGGISGYPTNPEKRSKRNGREHLTTALLIALCIFPALRGRRKIGDEGETHMRILTQERQSATTTTFESEQLEHQQIRIPSGHQEKSKSLWNNTGEGSTGQTLNGRPRLKRRVAIQ